MSLIDEEMKEYLKNVRPPNGKDQELREADERFIQSSKKLSFKTIWREFDL